MKLLRKLLGILPILSISFVALLAIITFFLGFGKVVIYNFTDCLSGGSCVHVNSAETAYSAQWYVSEELEAGNATHIVGFIFLLACLAFSILNVFNKTARGPWLLIAGIATFIIQFFFLVRPIVLVDIRTTDGIGDAFEAFNWITFGFSTLMWFNCIVLFILNKTLFKKVLAGDQPQQQAKAEPQAELELEEAPKAEVKEAKADNGWYCPECGKHNTGGFCDECGTKKPE